MNISVSERAAPASPSSSVACVRAAVEIVTRRGARRLDRSPAAARRGARSDARIPAARVFGARARMPSGVAHRWAARGDGRPATPSAPPSRWSSSGSTSPRAGERTSTSSRTATRNGYRGLLGDAVRDVRARVRGSSPAARSRTRSEPASRGVGGRRGRGGVGRGTASERRRSVILAPRCTLARRAERDQLPLARASGPRRRRLRPLARGADRRRSGDAARAERRDRAARACARPRSRRTSVAELRSVESSHRRRLALEGRRAPIRRWRRRRGDGRRRIQLREQGAAVRPAATITGASAAASRLRSRMSSA